MKRRYLYKNIRLYRCYGRWNAEYVDGNHIFTLHILGCATRYMAYNEAKKEVDYLNREA